jgi:hypothetical protein
MYKLSSSQAQYGSTSLAKLLDHLTCRIMFVDPNMSRDFSLANTRQHAMIIS